MKKRRFSDKGINFKLRKILIIMLFIFAFIFLVKIFLNYIEMKNKYDSVNNQINELKDENVKLESRIGKLYDDREYIEKVAREQLNMVKDGETVYIFTNDWFYCGIKQKGGFNNEKSNDWHGCFYFIYY